MDRQILRIGAYAIGLSALCSCTQSPQKMLYESPMRLTLRPSYVPPRPERSDDEPDDDDALRMVRRAARDG